MTLPKAGVVYGTYGTLNAARDNAVLLPSHYMAEPSRLRVADRSGPRARYRRNFSWWPPSCSATATRRRPATRRSRFTDRASRLSTIRDNVEAVHRLLVDDLKVTHLRASSASRWARSRRSSGR